MLTFTVKKQKLKQISKQKTKKGEVIFSTNENISISNLQDLYQNRCNEIKYQLRKL